MAWGKLGSTTATATVNSLDSPTYTGDIFQQIFYHDFAGTGGDMESLKFNDSGTATVYAFRGSRNGAADGTSNVTSQQYIQTNDSAFGESFAVIYACAIVGKEKLVIGTEYDGNTTTGAPYTNRHNFVGKFVPATDAPITKIALDSADGNRTYLVDSNISILGSDFTSSPPPNNVQDNSIFVEKDTANRFWFSAGGTTGSDIDLQTNTATGTGGGGNANTIMICESLTALTAGDVISKIGMDAQSTNNQPYGGVKLVVYTSNASGNPETLIGYTANLNPSGTGWFESTLVGGDHTITASEAGNVWIGFWAAGGIAYFKENKTNGIRQMDSQTYVSGNAPATTFVQNTAHNTEFKARLTYKDGTLATWTMEPTFEDDFSSNNGTEVGSIYSVSGGKLTGTSNRSSGYKYWAVDLGTTLSNTAWIVDFDIDFTSISLSSGYGAYNAIQLTSSKGTDGIGISWLDQTSNSKFYVQKAGSNAPYFNTTISTTGGDGSGKYYVRLIRDGANLDAILYSNSARTNVIEQEIKSITSTGLQYFQINNFNNSPGTWNANISFEIDNLKIYNGVTSIN